MLRSSSRGFVAPPEPISADSASAPFLRMRCDTQQLCRLSDMFRPDPPCLQLENLDERWVSLSAEMERQLQEARRGEREAVRAFVEAKAERDRVAGDEERNREVWFRAATSDTRLGGDAEQVSQMAASTIAEMERIAEERMAELEASAALRLSAAEDAAAQRIAEMEAAAAEAVKHVEALAAARVAAQAEQARTPGLCDSSMRACKLGGASIAARLRRKTRIPTGPVTGGTTLFPSLPLPLRRFPPPPNPPRPPPARILPPRTGGRGRGRRRRPRSEARCR